MRLGVVGSRDLLRIDLLDAALEAIVRVEGIDTIVSGGARGTDREAERWGRENLVDVVSFRPVNEGAGWTVDRCVYRPGKETQVFSLPGVYPTFGAAAFTRNGFIVDFAEQVLAMWDGRSTGTKDSITKARAAGKLREVVRF